MVPTVPGQSTTTTRRRILSASTTTAVSESLCSSTRLRSAPRLRSTTRFCYTSRLLTSPWIHRSPWVQRTSGIHGTTRCVLCWSRPRLSTGIRSLSVSSNSSSLLSPSKPLRILCVRILSRLHVVSPTELIFPDIAGQASHRTFPYRTLP